MHKSKKDTANVQSASLIDLKAELFRKQEEFKAQKLENQSSGFIKGKPSTSNKKPSLFSKKNAGVSLRAEKDFVEKTEEENVFERSRKALEQKAKMYEAISSGGIIPDEDSNELYLVDFQKKVLDDVAEKHVIERREKEEKERREIEEEQRQLLEPIEPAASVEEEWVDYVDAFGRTRSCLRKDLPDLQKQDKTLQHRKRDKPCDDSSPSLLSNDMRREIDRQQWERDELKTMEEEIAGPVHYTDVQHNEIRTHGVGYYKFDKEETVRQKQMEQLNELREQTKDERSKVEKIKEKRKAALAARLAKVKQRKRARLGLPELDEEEKADSEEEVGPKITEQMSDVKADTKVEPKPLTRDDAWRSEVKSTREWDKGKQYSMEHSEKAWLEKQRAEREQEFAPPSFYYDNVPNKPAGGGKAKKRKSLDDSEDIKTLIGKQLSDIRHCEKTDQASATPASNTLVVNLNIIPPSSTTSMSSNIHSHSSNIDTVNPNVTVPPPYVGAQSNYNAPPPGFNVPPTNVNVPPPNYNASPQNMNVQPPNYNVPPQNTNVPPPKYNVPPQNMNVPPLNYVPSQNMNVPPPNYNASPQNMDVPPPNYNASAQNTNVPPPNYYVPPQNINAQVPGFDAPPLNYSVPLPNCPPPFTSCQSDSSNISEPTHVTESVLNAKTETVRKTFVAKEDIIDTRLMENCD